MLYNYWIVYQESDTNELVLLENKWWWKELHSRQFSISDFSFMRDTWTNLTAENAEFRPSPTTYHVKYFEYNLTRCYSRAQYFRTYLLQVYSKLRQIASNFTFLKGSTKPSFSSCVTFIFVLWKEYEKTEVSISVAELIAVFCRTIV